MEKDMSDRRSRRDNAPDCFCDGRPCPTFYVRHTIAVSRQTGYEITSAVFRCCRCDMCVAQPEKWEKVE